MINKDIALTYISKLYKYSFIYGGNFSYIISSILVLKISITMITMINVFFISSVSI